ncbi:ROK family protein [Paenibacillus sp. FSL H7-0942]|nr:MULTISPECIES: ROK family protein [Paenibacillus]ETT41997.1 xylose repressor [Paenibacillus sp. FSL H7-689]OMF06727.1 transcriptional regulator [Paenibacillus amylolyticus]PKQ87362.1 ROK family protein [Paenibacillus sp. BGI2013]
MKKANATMMKYINLNNVREVMQQIETATKPQLALLTNLSVVTINALIQELCDGGELFQDKVVPSNGGRPAQAYRYNYNFKLALVLYIKEMKGQELISATVMNLENKVVLKEERILPAFDKQHMLQLIARFIKEYPSIDMIGIGIPGQAVDGDITVSSHEELIHSHLIREIESEFQLNVLVENDVNAAISGYCTQHADMKERSVAGIYFPNRYPPGMGMMLNGQMIRGKNGMFGEIKYLPYSPDWKRDMSKDDFVVQVCHILQTINAVVAPHQIVIYQERVEREELDMAWKQYGKDHPMPSLPEIVHQDSFQHDFDAGLRGMVLQALKSGILSEAL